MDKYCGVCTKKIGSNTSYRKFERLENKLKSVIERKCKGDLKYICQKCKRRVEKAADIKGYDLKVQTVCSCTPRSKRICKPPPVSTRISVHNCKTPAKRRPIRSRRSSQKKKAAQKSCDSHQNVQFPADSDVKVTLRQQNGQVRSLRIRNVSLQNICKVIGFGKSTEVVAKTILAQEPIFKYIVDIVLNKISCDAKKLAKTSTLSNSNADELSAISLNSLTNSWTSSSALFMPVVAALSGIDKYNNVPADVVFGASTLLRHRNARLSKLHHAVGLLLDHGGATDETIDVCHKLGICVSRTSVYNKKNEIAARHDREVHEMLRVPVYKVEQHYHASRAQSGGVVWSSKQMEAVLGNQVAVSPCVLPLSLRPHTGLSYLSVLDLPRIQTLPDWSACDSNKTLTIARAHSGTVLTAALHTKPTAIVNHGIASVVSSDISMVSDKDNSISSNMVPYKRDGRFSSAYSLTVTSGCELSSGQYSTPGIPYEIIGDNFDLTISPNEMTKDNQRKSIHWFLYCALNKRVSGRHLSDKVPNGQNSLSTTPCSTFLPDGKDIKCLEEDFVVFWSNIALQYMDFLKPFKCSYKNSLPHQYEQLTSVKSSFELCGLINKSENDSEGIISILQEIQKKVVPSTTSPSPKVLQKVVFGGDVLTNERAYSAQQAMANGTTDYECLGGFIHRPEGFHRMMNFVQIIYQMFYHQSADTGTLWCLRNMVNRRDVSGPKDVVQNYRSHFAFIDDVMTAHIVVKTLEHFGMESCDEVPTRNKPHPLTLLSEEQKSAWLRKEMSTVCHSAIKSGTLMFNELCSDTDNFNQENNALENMRRNSAFVCSECGKAYKRKTGIKRHLERTHEWAFSLCDENMKKPNSKKTVPASDHDSLFLFMALLLKSTSEAFKFGDGERAMRNVKFEGVFAGAIGHTKYRLWLWRMLAYVKCILSPRQAFEYTWNISANILGGIGNNIPNDNLVEIMVKTIKKKLKTQGANVTFQSALTACKTVKYLDMLRDMVMKESGGVKHSGKHTKAKKDADIKEMCNKLQSVNCNRELNIKLPAFNSSGVYHWVAKQSERAAVEMV